MDTMAAEAAVGAAIIMVQEITTTMVAVGAATTMEMETATTTAATTTATTTTATTETDTATTEATTTATMETVVEMEMEVAKDPGRKLERGGKKDSLRKTAPTGSSKEWRGQTRRK